MPKVDAIALDMDGLLFDTERLYFRVGDEILKPRGFRFSAELQSQMMGRIGLAAMDAMIQFHRLDDEPESLLRESDAIYSRLLETDLRPMPGLDDWIARLCGSGLPFALTTSSRRLFVDRILSQVDWANSLRFILSGDDVVRGKPDPEIYVKAAAIFEVPPSRMLVLEDSGNGTAAGVAAGAKVVAIPNDHTQTHSFDGAILTADSLADPRLHDLILENQNV
ncbi:MAG: HAD-IA family hydrolase [Planctomycetota bacterium]